MKIFVFAVSFCMVSTHIFANDFVHHRSSVSGFPTTKILMPKPPFVSNINASQQHSFSYAYQTKSQNLNIPETNTENLKTANKTPLNFPEKEGYFFGDFELGVGVGILGGMNVNIGFRPDFVGDNFLERHIGFRVDFNSWKPLESQANSYFERHPIELDGNDFIGKIGGENFGFLIDFYPFVGASFRISGGLYSGDFGLSASHYLENGGEIFIAGKDFKVNGGALDLTANLKTDVSGPYAGMGFDLGMTSHLKIYVDAGVVFVDKPRISAGLIGGDGVKVYRNHRLIYRGNLTENDDLKNEILSAITDAYTKEFSNLLRPYHPILKVGVKYKF